MLADHLFADRTLKPTFGKQYWNFLRKSLRQSMKFSFEPDATRGADVLAADPAQLVKSMPLFRIPFKKTWIELATKDRPRSDIEGSDLEVPTKRIGFLVEAIDDTMQRGLITIWWSLERDETQCNTSGMAGAFNFHDDTELPFQTKRTQDEIRDIVNNFDGSRSVARAALEMDKHFSEIPNPYMHELWEMAFKKFGPIGKEDPPPEFKAMCEQWRNDWQGEFASVMSMVIFINSSRIVKFRDGVRPKLDRSRVRRRKAPLFSHQTVSLAFNAIQESDHRSRDGSPPRAHFVRGHFKSLPRIGLTWWNPHLRGDMARGFVDKDYSVIKEDE